MPMTDAQWLTLFQTKYPVTGSTQIYVDQASGNDGNPGTSALPKATLAGGISAVGSSGKVWVRNGTYAPTSINGKNGSASANVLVMAEAGAKPKLVNNGGGAGFDLLNCSYLGIYGFEIIGAPSQGNPYNDGITITSCHHVYIWKMNIHDTGHAIGMPGNFGKSHNCTLAYNICGPNLSRWNPYASSAISYYSGTDGGNAADGYSMRMIGNITFDAVNDLSTASTDGNGIIIDACNSSAGQGGTLVNDKTLLAFNLSVNNGARGLHAFMSNNVDMVFNTVAHNVRMAGQGGISSEQGEATQYGSSNGKYRWNATATRTGRSGGNNVYYQGAGWDGSSGNTAHIQNAVIRGDIQSLTNNYDKRSVGDAYWQAPQDMPTNPAGWRPVSTTQQTVDLSSVTDGNTIYAVLSQWPDFFGDYRPTNKIWSCGWTEAVAGSGGGGAPVADFTYTPATPAPGSAIAFLDTSTNTPTSWLWNFGDGSTSTAKNPAKTYTQSGNYSVSLTATNGTGSGSQTKSIVVATAGSTVWYEAETATLGGGTEPPVVSTSNPGYSAGGYVGFFGRTGNYVDFTITGVAAGQYTLLLRWGRGEAGTATRDVRVNNVTIASPSLDQTATDWSDPARWVTSAPITITLTAGSNAIRIAHAGNDYTYTDLDRIGLTPQGSSSNAPVANFGYAPSEPTPGSSVAFTDQSTQSPTSWAWSFGDATTSTARNPVKTYTLAGSYVVQLTATNSVGSSTIQKTVIVSTGGGGGGGGGDVPVVGSMAVGGSALLNNTAYTAHIQVRDSTGLIGEDTEDFSTSWSAPATSTLTITSLYNTSGYVKLEWTNSGVDPNFVAWRIYRRTVSPTGEWVLVMENTNNVATYEYHDWLAASTVAYQYALVQVATRFGQAVESGYTPSSNVTPSDDRYWLVHESDETKNLLLHVTSDDFQPEVEQETMQLIGRGRRREFGTEWGATGSIAGKIRNDGIDTPSNQRIKAEAFARGFTSFYIRTPFGDVWRVTVATIPMSRVAGVGMNEMIDVQLDWEEMTV